ncbi:MAG TPA: hypothetical protein P5528_10275 [Steroidobacteraceae bacterium]|nr:hypothetical protein [Steroidobacteraceae bacterium]HRX89819.1 hypothetical protein [Steroidobacteraceae bacterium]
MQLDLWQQPVILQEPFRPVQSCGSTLSSSPVLPFYLTKDPASKQ